MSLFEVLRHSNGRVRIWLWQIPQPTWVFLPTMTMSLWPHCAHLHLIRCLASGHDEKEISGKATKWTLYWKSIAMCCFQGQDSHALQHCCTLAHFPSLGNGVCLVTLWCGGCARLTPFRQTRVPWLHTVRFSLAAGLGQSGESPEHTLAFWQSVSSSHLWPSGLNSHFWPQHRPWLGLMNGREKTPQTWLHMRATSKLNKAASRN